MIENAALKAILLTATDISTVCEIYSASAVPGTNGLDPADAIDCFAAVSGITFRTRTYKRLVKKFGRIKRTLGKETNSTSVEFSNLDNQISQFEFTNGFEGLILVVRLISRSRSIVLTDSQILFTGQCEKPRTGNRKSLSVSAKFILGSKTVTIPRRKFTKEDQEGRVSTDPEFEGFIYTPAYGTTAYSVRQKRGGIAGLFGFKRNVTHTMQWSSFSDIDANKDVPEIFGRAQVLGVHLSYVDVGTAIRLRTAFCEGEIEDIQNARSTDTSFPLSATSYAELYGKVGTLNGPDDPGWAGATGYFSRTAHIRGQADNSLVASTDPAPDIAAVILGKKMLTPTTGGAWSTTAWTNNGSAHARFLITSPDYSKLADGWVDDASFFEVFNFNAEQIFNTSINDFMFVEPG